jgi:hypothetical protein
MQSKKISPSIRHLHWLQLGKEGNHGFSPINQPDTVKINSFRVLERKTFLRGGSDCRPVSISDKIYYQAKGVNQLLEDEKLRSHDSDESLLKDTMDSVETQYVSKKIDDMIDAECIKIDAKRCPFLSKINSRVNKNMLLSLINEIVWVSQQSTNDFKFEYQTSHGMKRNLIIVPQTSTDTGFDVRVKPVLKEFLKAMTSESLIKKMKASKTGLSEDESVNHEERKNLYRIIDFYCISERETFVKVAKDRKILLDDKVMPLHMAAAMFAESHIGPTKSRIVNRYLTAFFGRRIMPSEEKIFRDELAIDDIPPRVISKELDTKIQVKYFVKPLDRVIFLGISKLLMKPTNINKAMDIDCIRVSYAADHGGSFFRTIIKCAVLFHDGQEMDFKYRLGQMQCKKDSYELIAQTMGPLMNIGLCSILEHDRKTPKPIAIYRNDNIDAASTFIIKNISTGDNDTLPPGYSHVTTIPSVRVKIAITGDLAFYATMMGKPNMDSKWCYRCNLAAKEWASIDPIIVGDLWTRELLSLKLMENDNNPNLSSYEKKGVKVKPILDIDPSLYIIPPLHVKLGLVNSAFISSRHSYFSWSKARVENIPEQERVSNSILINAQNDLKDRLEDQNIWNTMKLDSFLDIKERLKEVSDSLKVNGLSNHEKQTIEENLTLVRTELEEMKDEMENIKMKLKDARVRVKASKTAHDIEKKKRTFMSNLIQNQKENAMKDLGIDRGAAHGGDLQGRGCTTFLQKADLLFDRFLEIDLAAVRDGTALASEQEVHIVNKKFKQLAILLEGLMHFIMLDETEIRSYDGRDDFIPRVHSHVEVLTWFWNHLRLSLVAPKFHAIKDHLVQQFEQWGAIGPFNEEFAEADHVDGNSEIRSYGALRDTQRREEAISKRAAMMTHETVVETIDSVSPSRKRQSRLTLEDRERIKQRRSEVFEECKFIKECFDSSSQAQILDYFNA